MKLQRASTLKPESLEKRRGVGGCATGVRFAPESRIAPADAEAFTHGVWLVLCQQSVSTAALLGHARHHVAPTAQAAEME
jgi:hypothetical protein